MALAVSDEGLKFIASHEGLRLQLYNDPAGHCTIGVGHLVHRGPCNGSEPAEFQGGITEQRAFEILRKDASGAAAAVNAAIKVKLTQNQFDALVSFVFNLGSGSLDESNSTLARELNKGNYNAVPAQMLRWVKADDKVLPGLVRRRKEEGELWNSSSPPLKENDLLLKGGEDEMAVIITVAGTKKNYVTNFVVRRFIKTATERKDMEKAGLPSKIHQVSQATLNAIPEVK